MELLSSLIDRRFRIIRNAISAKAKIDFMGMDEVLIMFEKEAFDCEELCDYLLRRPYQGDPIVAFKLILLVHSLRMRGISQNSAIRAPLRSALDQIVNYWAKIHNTESFSAGNFRTLFRSFIVKYGQNICEGFAANSDWDFCFTSFWHIKGSFFVKESWKMKIEGRATEIIVVLKALLPYAISLSELTESLLTIAVNKFSVFYKAAAELLVAECNSLSLSLSTLLILCIILCYPLTLIDLVNEEQTVEGLEFFILKSLWNNVSLSYRSMGGKLEDLQVRIASELISLRDIYIRLIKRLESLQKLVYPLQWKQWTTMAFHPPKLHVISSVFDDLPALAKSLSKSSPKSSSESERPPCPSSEASPKKSSKESKFPKNSLLSVKNGKQGMTKTCDNRSPGFKRKKKPCLKGRSTPSHSPTMASQSHGPPYRGQRESEGKSSGGESSSFFDLKLNETDGQTPYSFEKQTFFASRPSSVERNESVAANASQRTSIVVGNPSFFMRNESVETKGVSPHGSDASSGGWRRKGISSSFAATGGKGYPDVDRTRRMHFLKIPFSKPGKEKALNVSTRGGTKDVHVAHSRKSVEKTASFFEKHQNEDNSANSNAQKYAVIKFSPEMVSSAWKGNPNSNFVQSDTPVTPTPYEGSKLLGSKMHKKNFADEGNEQEGIPPCLYQQMPLPYAPPPDFLCSEPSVFTQTPMVAYWPNGSSTGVSVTPVGASDKERNGVESRAFPRDPTGTMAMAAVPLFRGNPSHSTMRSPPFYIMRPYPPSGGVEKEEASNGGPPALIGASSLMDWHHPSGNHAMTRPAAPPAAPVIQGAPYTKGAMPLQVSLPAGNPMGVFHPSPFCKSSTSAQGGKMPFLPSEEGLSLFEPTIRSLGGKDAPAELPPSLSIPHPAGSREVHRGVPTLPCSPSTSQRPSSLLPTSFRKPQRNDVNKLSTAGLSSGRLVSSRMRPKEETKEASGSWMRSKESESNDVPSLEATPPQKSPGELPALIFSRPAGPVLSPLYEETRAGNVDELVELGGEPSTASSSPIPLKLIKDPPGSSILETRKQSRTSDDFRGPVGYSLGRKRAPARPADGSANGIVGAEGDPPSKNPPPEGIFDLLPMGRSMTPSPLLSSPSLTKETPEVFGLPSKLPLPSGASRSNRLCSPQPSRVRSFSAEGDNLNGNCVPAKTSSPVIVSKAPPYGVGGPAGGLRGRPPADIPTLIPPLAGMAGNSLSVAGSSPPGQQLSPPPAGGRAMSPLPPILSQRNPAQATIPQFKNSHPTPVHVGAPPLLNGVGNLPIPLNHPDNAPLTLRESQLKRAPAELGLGMNNALLASLEIDPAEVKVTFEVGVGATSVVFKGLWRGTDVALKRLKVNVSEDNTREFLKELAIMTRLRHPNLVLLMGIISQTAPYYVVTEFCAGGTLFDILHKYRINLTWSQRIKIAGDIAKGCTYLHASQPQILHRDLKSLNILLAEPIAGVNVPLAKVSDFGMSKIRQQADIKNMTGMAGTFQWMAPEVLHNRPYDEKVDIYSYGIVLYELITSRVPYEECHHSSAVTTAIAVAQGLRPDLRRIPNECPRTLRSLMVACWDSRPQKRPTFSQIVDILKHPCLDGKI